MFRSTRKDRISVLLDVGRAWTLKTQRAESVSEGLRSEQLYQDRYRFLQPALQRLNIYELIGGKKWTLSAQPVRTPSCTGVLAGPLKHSVTGLQETDKGFQFQVEISRVLLFRVGCRTCSLLKTQITARGWFEFWPCSGLPSNFYNMYLLVFTFNFILFVLYNNKLYFVLVLYKQYDIERKTNRYFVKFVYKTLDEHVP